MKVMELRNKLNETKKHSGSGMIDDARVEVDRVLMEIEDIYVDTEGVHILIKDDPDY